MKPQQNKALMACFDLPCAALFGGPSRWPETNIKSHIQSSPSRICWTSQNSCSVCAQNAKHQNTTFKGGPQWCRCQESLKSSNDNFMLRAWSSHICASVHTVRWCMLGIELYSVNVNTSIIMA